MGDARLTKIGGVCALLMVACFVVGFVLMGTSGVQVLIPETGEEGLEWIADVDGAGDSFFAGAWLGIAGGFLGLVALVGFYDALRGAGPWIVLAPVLGVVWIALVTISHLIPVAMAYELVPGYVDADAATQASLAVTSDTLAVTAAVVNYAGNALGWGVVVPPSTRMRSSRPAPFPAGSAGSASSWPCSRAGSGCSRPPRASSRASPRSASSASSSSWRAWEWHC